MKIPKTGKYVIAWNEDKEKAIECVFVHHNPAHVRPYTVNNCRGSIEKFKNIEIIKTRGVDETESS